MVRAVRWNVCENISILAVMKIYVKIMTDFASVIIYYQKRGSYYGGNKTGCYSFHRVI